jgi:hypothetical protein
MEEILVFFSRLKFSSSTDVDDIDTLKYSAEKEEPFKLKSVTREENTIEAYSDHVTIEIKKDGNYEYRFSISLKSSQSIIKGYIRLNYNQTFSSITVSSLSQSK